MKVGELRKALEGVDPDLEIVLRAWDDDGSDYCGTIGAVAVQHSHVEYDTPFLAIDAGPEDAR